MRARGQTDALTDALTGALFVALTLAVIAYEWTGSAASRAAADLIALPALVLLALTVSGGRRVFLAVGAALVLWALASRPDWIELTRIALAKATFIGAFFTALATLRAAAGSSRAIAECGRYLADQPPGRRYLALSVGGHLFGLFLSYGAISLLGSLAETSARRESDPEIRRHRERRMLLAIQRGFVATLPWSPLAFAVAVSTSVIPGARWADAVWPCLVSAAIIAGTGWALDTIFKPRLSPGAAEAAWAQRAGRIAAGWSWRRLTPLLVLLALLGSLVLGLHLATAVRVFAVVMAVVPLVALGWIALQGGRHGGLAHVGARASLFLREDLPAYRGDLALLMMAAFIGTLGARLVAPVLADWGFDLGVLASWQVLLIVFLTIPVTGQLGMNPILSVTLLAPLLPAPEALGVAPAALIVAITAGWALSGASSPYTATTVIVGAIGRVSPWRVGVIWNGAYTLLTGAALGGWVLLAASLL